MSVNVLPVSSITLRAELQQWQFITVTLPPPLLPSAEPGLWRSQVLANRWASSFLCENLHVGVEPQQGADAAGPWGRVGWLILLWSAEPALGAELLKNVWRASTEELALNEMHSQFSE